MSTATAKRADKGTHLSEVPTDKSKTLFKAQGDEPSGPIKLIDKKPPPNARAGTPAIQLTNELLSRLKAECEPLPSGERRGLGEAGRSHQRLPAGSCTATWSAARSIARD